MNPKEPTKPGGKFLHGLTANVIVFGFVSFLTDVSAEMIYPLLPLFLSQTLGAGPIFLGLIEGVAESTCSFLKLYSGIHADRARDRSKLVLFGYTLSSFSRPLMALAQSPWTVLFIRAADRTGKGIRTSPRDALLADSTHSDHHGRAFGFQRSMDNAGSVVGPLISTILLAYFIKDLRIIFWLAAIPGVMAVLLIIFKVREVRERTIEPTMKFSWKFPRGKLGIYLVILFVFTLSNSSDAFLLLHAQNCGVPIAQIPLLWMALHIVKTSTVMPFGALSDRLGRRRLILCGWLVYAVVYILFGYATSASQIWLIFILYGLFSGFTEGTERAFLADLTTSGVRGKAYGWYNFIVGVATLPASLLFGILWKTVGAQFAFLIDACLALTAALMLSFFIRHTRLRAQPIANRL